MEQSFQTDGNGEEEATRAVAPLKVVVSAPRDFLLGPVFAATKQNSPRSVTVLNRRYQIGGVHPLDPKQTVHPGLSMPHFRAYLAVNSFQKALSPTIEVSFSVNDLCRRYAHSTGGQFAKNIKALLWDLRNTPFSVTELDTGRQDFYWILDSIHIHTKPIRRKDDFRAGSTQTELWIDRVQFTSKFFELMNRIAELAFIRLDVLVSITSQLAQAIYAYIPSRAHHHKEADPFEITLTNLLEQVGHPVPHKKSRRQQLFTRNKNSILSQLDGKETLSGVFRVRLAETSDEKDWKLQCWVEKSGQQKTLIRRARPKSKLVQLFIDSAHTQEEADRRLDSMQPLTGYELELLTRGKIVLEGNQKSFEIAKALLGESKFQALLSEAKGDALEGRPATKTPNHRLMSRIKETITVLKTSAKG